MSAKSYDAGLESVLNQFDGKYGEVLVAPAHFDADVSLYSNADDAAVFENVMDSVLNQFDSKWNNFDVDKGSDVKSESGLFKIKVRKDVKLSSAPVKKKNGFDFGVAAAVAAVAGLLFLVGFASNSAGSGSSSSDGLNVSDVSGGYSLEAERLLKVFSDSVDAVNVLGVEELYYDTDNNFVGAILFNPEISDSETVLWDEKSGSWSFDGVDALASQSVAGGGILSPADEVVSNEEGVFFITASDGTCVIVGTTEGLMTSLFFVECLTNELVEDSLNVAFKYGVSVESAEAYADALNSRKVQ